MTKAAAYLRVSTGNQTTDNQLPAVRDWVTSHGYDLADEGLSPRAIAEAMAAEGVKIGWRTIYRMLERRQQGELL